MEKIQKVSSINSLNEKERQFRERLRFPKNNERHEAEFIEILEAKIEDRKNDINKQNKKGSTRI